MGSRDRVLYPGVVGCSTSSVFGDFEGETVRCVVVVVHTTKMEDFLLIQRKRWKGVGGEIEDRG